MRESSSCATKNCENFSPTRLRWKHHIEIDMLLLLREFTTVNLEALMNPIGGMLLARFSSVLFTLGYLCKLI